MKKTNLILFVILLFSSNVFANEKMNVNDFFNKHQGKELYFNSNGASEFEYICERPSVSVDCRVGKINYLKNQSEGSLKITNLINFNDKEFFEIFINDKKYFINAEKIISGFNFSNFYLNKKTYSKNNNVEEYLKSKIGSKYFSDNEVYLCNKQIVISNCNSKDSLTITNFKVKLKNVKTINGRLFLNLNINSLNKNYWIDYFLFKTIFKKERA